MAYFDSFESYAVNSEAQYFADQTGSFEIYQSNFNNNSTKTMRQSVPVNITTNAWCGASPNPVSIIGDLNMTNYFVGVDVLIETTGTAILGSRVQGPSGCSNTFLTGYYIQIDQDGNWEFLEGEQIVTSGQVPSNSNQFHTLSIVNSDDQITVFVDDIPVYWGKSSAYAFGWAAIGSSWDYVQFDNFILYQNNQV